MYSLIENPSFFAVTTDEEFLKHFMGATSWRSLEKPRPSSGNGG